MTSAPRRRERRTAVGTLQIGLAQTVAAISAVAIQVVLARALLPEGYGTLSVVTAVIIWWELAGGSLYGLAGTQRIATATDWQRVAATMVWATARWALILTLIYALAAPAMARLLRDPSLTPYLWLFGLDLLLYSLYRTFCAILLGRRRYGRHAAVDIVYWIAKAVLMIALVWIGFAVTGAIVGSIAASAIALGLGWRLTGAVNLLERSSSKDLITFGTPLLLTLLVMQILQTMDLWCVKALLLDEAATGHFGAAKLAFQMTRLLPLAVLGAMFPALTQAVAAGDKKLRGELISMSFRFVLVVTFMMLGVVGCCAREIVELVFSSLYAPAAQPMTILIGAGLLYSLWGITFSIMIAAGRAIRSLVPLLITLPVNVALNFVLIRRFGLNGAALATLTTNAVLVVVMLSLIWRDFRVLFPALTLVRTVAATAAVWALGYALPPLEGWYLVLKLSGLVAIYGVLLVVSGELARSDFERLVPWLPNRVA